MVPYPVSWTSFVPKSTTLAPPGGSDLGTGPGPDLAGTNELKRTKHEFFFLGGRVRG